MSQKTSPKSSKSKTTSCDCQDKPDGGACQIPYSSSKPKCPPYGSRQGSGSRCPSAQGRSPGGASAEPTPRTSRDPSRMERGPSGMERGSTTMERGPSGMERGSSGIEGRSSAIGRGSSGIEGRSSAMGRGSSGMGRGPSGMERGSSGIEGRSSGMGRGPSAMERACSTMERGTSAMERVYSTMERGTSAMERGSSGMGRGPSAVERGSSGMGRGPSAVERGPSAVERGSSGMGRGSSAMERGPAAVERGTSAMERACSTMERGTSAMERGSSGMARAPSAVERGSSGMRRGPSAMERGPAAVERGTSAMERACSTMERGTSAMGRGSSGMGRGPSAVERGSSGMGRGPSAVGRGSSGMGRGSSAMEKVCSTMERGLSRAENAEFVMSTDLEQDSCCTEPDMAQSATTFTVGKEQSMSGGSSARLAKACPQAPSSAPCKTAACSGMATCGASAFEKNAYKRPMTSGRDGHHHRDHGHDHPDHDHELDHELELDHEHDHEHDHELDLGHDHEHHHPGPGELLKDEKAMAALGHLSQIKKTPSYLRCKPTFGNDFLSACAKKDSRKGQRVAKLPDIPCLESEDIDNLVKCEAQDVETTWYLVANEKKTYKKPCPKQQKAQMTVKALVQAHAGQGAPCGAGKEYSPLEHPDPEDISPELAAAMMFSQEKGIKMEECPKYTITSLFPDEPPPPFPVNETPHSSISVVDRGSKDQDDPMMEKSASVPSEGVSDSAYSRTMKEKGEEMGVQKSFDVDFAIGQSKREYVLVAEKPQRINKVQYRGGNSPPWFPGYFSAFPGEEGIKMVSSPSGIFNKAWFHANPTNMPTSDVIVLD